MPSAVAGRVYRPSPTSTRDTAGRSCRLAVPIGEFAAAANGFRNETRAREMLYVSLSQTCDLLIVCSDLDPIRRVGGEGVTQLLTTAAAG